MDEPRARRPWLRGCGLRAIALLVLTLPILLAAERAARRPPRRAWQQELAPGLTYQRGFQGQPRPLVWHLVAVDLRQPGLELRVTPGAPGPDGHEIAAQTTREFVRASGARVAINGSFFQPAYTRHPWDFYPRSGDRVAVLGQAIANGRQYSPPQESWSVFCVAPEGRVAILAVPACPPQTRQALAGSPILVQDGELVAGAIAVDPQPRPRTVVGVNAAGDRLWLLVIDGRQPFYSQGATFADVAEMLRDRGAAQVLVLDGGGSTTLVQATPGGPQVLNAPIHTRIPARERPVANHLGVWVRPAAWP